MYANFSIICNTQYCVSLVEAKRRHINFLQVYFEIEFLVDMISALLGSNVNRTLECVVKSTSYYVYTNQILQKVKERVSSNVNYIG